MWKPREILCSWEWEKKKKKGLGKIWILVLEEVIDPKMEKVWIYGMQGG